MSVQNGAMDVRQSDATGRMRLTSVISPAHVCVHSTTQARSQDFPRGGVLFGGKVDLTPKRGGGSHLVKMWTFVLYPMEPLAQGVGGPDPPPLATGLRRESISRRTAEMETPDRPVASHPGGGGLNLDGWNTIDLYMVWLGCLGQGFSTSGSRPHLGSPSDFRGVARDPSVLKRPEIPRRMNEIKFGEYFRHFDYFCLSYDQCLH